MVLRCRERGGASVSPKPDNGSDLCSEVVGQDVSLGVFASFFVPPLAVLVDVRE
jgi:hypothetical protein